MSELCPVYLSSGDCLVKVLSNPRLSSFISKIQLDVVIESWGKDCQGDRNLCTFKHQIEEPAPSNKTTEPANRRHQNCTNHNHQHTHEKEQQHQHHTQEKNKRNPHRQPKNSTSLQHQN